VKNSAPIDWSYWGIYLHENTISNSTLREFSLAGARTAALFSEANNAFHTEPLELMLASKIYFFQASFMDRELPIFFNETHGRYSWGEEIDLSRTVGWFTSMHPSHLHRSEMISASDVLRRTKDMLRRTDEMEKDPQQHQSHNPPPSASLSDSFSARTKQRKSNTGSGVSALLVLVIWEWQLLMLNRSSSGKLSTYWTLISETKAIYSNTVTSTTSLRQFYFSQLGLWS
jgi:hypothetical protein